ncbi:unnamed protein product [Ascophyllum nodosum]
MALYNDENNFGLLRELALKLRRRNAEQTVAFRDVFKAHEGLLQLNAKLRQQTVDQDKDIIILRHKLTEGLSQGETSDVLRTMQGELQRLHMQVSDKYRSSAEAASEQLRLMKEAQLLQDQLRHCKGSLEKLQGEHRATLARCATLEDGHALLEAALDTQHAETESLRGLLGAKEAEAASVREQARKERDDFVSRLLRDKERMLEEMNKMNDETEALRGDKRALTAKLRHTEAGGATRLSRTFSGGDSERPRGAAPDWLAPHRPQEDETGGGGGGGGSGDTFPGVPRRCFQAIEAHSSGIKINDVVFERSGVSLVTAGDDSYVKVWDPASGRQRAALKGAAHKGFSAMVTADISGDLVCGGASDGSCTVWSVKTCREKARLTGHQQKVCAVAFCCSGKRIVTGSQDCSIKMWDLHRGCWDATTTMMRATSKCNTLDVSRTWTDSTGVNAVVASGHMDGIVRLWDMRTGSCAQQLQGLHSDQVTSVKFAPGKGNMLLTNSKDSTLKLVDARTNRAVASLSHPNYRTATNFSRACLSPSALYAAAASSNGNVYVWDVARCSEGGPPAPVPTSAPASASAEGASSAEVVVVLETHGAAASGCDWCLNTPNTLASCDVVGGLRIWG